MVWWQSIFEAIGKGIVLGLKKGGLGFLAIFKNKNLFRGFLGIFFFFILVGVSIKEGIEQKNPLIPIQEVSEFFVLIDKQLGDATAEILTNGWSFLGILSILVSIYVYYIYTKWIYKILFQWFGEGISSVIIAFTAFAILWLLQLIWSLLATFALKIEPTFWFPFTGIKLLVWDLILQSDLLWGKLKSIVESEKKALGAKEVVELATNATNTSINLS